MNTKFDAGSWKRTHSAEAPTFKLNSIATLLSPTLETPAALSMFQTGSEELGL